MRWLAPLLAVALAAPSHAGPLDPRGKDETRVWRIERIGAAPRTLSFPVRFSVKNERSMLFGVGFERKATGRDFHDAQFTSFFLNPSGGAYPRAYYEGHGPLLPACPARVACTEPEAKAGSYRLELTFGRPPTRLGMYLVAVNLTMHEVGATPGWRVTALPPDSVTLHTIRTGTGIDTNVVAGVDRFTSARAPATTRPSRAIGVIPCPWGPSGPTGPGHATLDGGGPLTPVLGPYDDRHPTCERLEIGRAANPRPTTWLLRGDATGLLVAPFHLVVLELPAER